MIKITDKGNCTGCTACYNICPKHSITMLSDHEGFLYPHVNEQSCIECGLCVKVCPILNYGDTPKNEVMSAYAAHHKNKNTWYLSSSGGAFSSIVEYVLENHGVVYGAAYNDDFKVCHERADNNDDALKFRGSKYSQSVLYDIFKDVKNDLSLGKLVMFSGTPCQIAGLQSFLRKDYKNLLTVDLICHCVPSPKVFNDYISFIERKYKKKIVYINMKDKTEGWPVQSPRIYFDDGTTLFGEYDSYLWEKIFYSYLAIRPSCHKCKFSNLNRGGDITVGDYWGVEKIHPEFNHPNGASLVLVNTNKGHKYFTHISNSLDYTNTNAQKALPNTLLYTTKPNSRRSQFWKDYSKLSFEKLTKKYFEPRFYKRFKQIVYKILLLPYKLFK